MDRTVIINASLISREMQAGSRDRNKLYCMETLQHERKENELWRETEAAGTSVLLPAGREILRELHGRCLGLSANRSREQNRPPGSGAGQTG